MHPEPDQRHLDGRALSEALQSLPPSELADVGDAVAEHLAGEQLREDPPASLNAPHLPLRPPPLPPEQTPGADPGGTVFEEGPPSGWVVFQDEAAAAVEELVASSCYLEPGTGEEPVPHDRPPPPDPPDLRPVPVESGMDFLLGGVAFAPPPDEFCPPEGEIPLAEVAPAEPRPEAETVPPSPPISQVDPLPPVVHARQFLVSWSGQAGSSGLGPEFFDVYVAVDGGPFTLWRRQTRDVSARFTGDYGRRYAFCCVATDRDGNAETPPGSPQAETRLLRQKCLLEVKANAGLTLDRFTVADVTADLLRVSDLDFGPEQITFTLVQPPAHGNLLRGRALLTAGATFTQEDVDSRQLRYQHGGNRASHDRFTCSVSDGAGGAIEDLCFRLSVLPVRSAPVLEPRHVPRLTPVLQGTTNPRGDRVAELVGDSIRLTGPEGKAGIAVVGLTETAHGVWQYSVTGGTTWVDFGDVYHGQARLLRGGDRVRFVPHPSFHGQARLAYRAWDQTAGAPGAVANLAGADATGGATAFSSTLATAGLTIQPSPERGAWSAERQDQTAPRPPRSELRNGRSVASLVGVAGHGEEPELLEGIAVVALQGNRHGLWQYSLTDGQTWIDFGEVFHGRARLLRATDRVRFLPRPNFHGPVALTYRTWDRTTGKPGETVNLASTEALRETTAFAPSAESVEWHC